jgi:hypothetical protein
LNPGQALAVTFQATNQLISLCIQRLRQSS